MAISIKGTAFRNGIKRILGGTGLEHSPVLGTFFTVVSALWLIALSSHPLPLIWPRGQSGLNLSTSACCPGQPSEPKRLG